MGLVSPIASTQCRIMGRFTGSGAGRGRLSPAAAARAAASVIDALPVSVPTTPLFTSGPIHLGAYSPRARSPRDPGQAEPGGCDEFPLDLVDPPAEGQDGVPFGLNVEPAAELGGFLLSRVPVPRHNLFK